MKVAVVNHAWPFLHGGAEHLASELTAKLREFGHEAVLLKLPFVQTPHAALARSILAARLLRIPISGRIICLRFPTYFIPHEDKVLWLLHQYRGAYELWNTPFKSLPVNEEGRQIRQIIRRADDEALREVRKIYTNHETTADRLRRYNGILAEPLTCPFGDSSRFHCAGYGDTIAALGRISRVKRQALAVEAMAYTRTPVKLHVAGFSEEAELTESIHALIRARKLEEKVTFEPRFISEEEKTALLARCLAAVYVPFDEDAVGYVTAEAFFSQKACVTCHDSGGVTFAVRSGLNGFVVEPDPRAIAEAFDRLYSDRALARRLGENACQWALSIPNSWEHVIGKLLS